ncbi:MAG TPA: hypothetical protein VMD30_08260 [Tepidisphaeraceae bacterium]|nr:hypothetical protein [Tepidisphaeraceae bacterium]
MKYAGRIAVIGGMFAAAAMLFLAGCSPTDATDRDDMADMYNQPNKALSDPFGYSPDMSDSDMSNDSQNGLSNDFDSDFQHGASNDPNAP